MRAAVWRIADFLESRQAFLVRWRWWIFAAALSSILLGIGYQRWAQGRSIRVARQWLAAGRFDRVGPAIAAAIADQPLRPEPWQLASELAWRRKQKAEAVRAAEHAAELSHGRSDYVLAWAELALLASDRESAEKAMAQLAPNFIAHSARAERAAAVLARQHEDFALERQHFTAALKLDEAAHLPTGIDDVPLQTLLYRLGTAEERAAAGIRLERWSTDPRWGADALRGLLADALSRRHLGEAVRWAEALRAHPRFSLDDVPRCLAALAAADETRFSKMLGSFQSEFRNSPSMSALLMGDLLQIGRPQEVLAWHKSLPAAEQTSALLSVEVAEALRLTGQWSELKQWVELASWTPQTRFLQTVYRMEAARGLREEAELTQELQRLRRQVQANGAYTMFAASNLYGAGLRAEAVELFWTAADIPDVAVTALGTLARHYQLEHDAIGQYKAFRRLHALRRDDAGVAHNFAYFAVLSGNFDYGEIERIVVENHRRDPSNLLYLANYAFVLHATGRAAMALTLLEPRAEAWNRSEPFAFAYGLVLAANGRKAEARQVLARIDPKPLTVQERELIASAVN